MSLTPIQVGCGRPGGTPPDPVPPPGLPPQPGGPNPGPNPDPTVAIGCMYEFRAIYDCDYHGLLGGVGNIESSYQVTSFPSGGLGPFAESHTDFDSWKPMSQIRLWCNVSAAIVAKYGNGPAGLAVFNAIPKGTWMACGLFSYCQTPNAGCVNIHNRSFRKGKEIGYAYFHEIIHQVPVTEVATFTCPDALPLKDYPYYQAGDAGPRIPDFPANPPCYECYKLDPCGVPLPGCGAVAGGVVVSNSGGKTNPRYECAQYGSFWDPANFSVIQEMGGRPWPNQTRAAIYNGGAFFSGNNNNGTWNCLVPTVAPLDTIPAAALDYIRATYLIGQEGAGKYGQSKDCRTCAYDHLFAFQRCGVQGGYIDPDSCPANTLIQKMDEGKIVFRRLRVDTVDEQNFIDTVKAWGNSFSFLYTDYYCWIGTYIPFPNIIQHRLSWWNAPSTNASTGAPIGRAAWTGAPIYISSALYQFIRVPVYAAGPPKVDFGNPARPIVTGGKCCDCYQTYRGMFPARNARVGTLDCRARGACCTQPTVGPPDRGNCQNDRRADECTAVGSRWYGNKDCNDNAVSLGTGDCVKLYGACCNLLNASCRNTTRIACRDFALKPVAAGGFPSQFKGEGNWCAGAACPDPLGCCCRTESAAVGGGPFVGNEARYWHGNVAGVAVSGNMTQNQCAVVSGGMGVWSSSMPCKLRRVGGINNKPLNSRPPLHASLIKPPKTCFSVIGRNCTALPLTQLVWKMKFRKGDGTSIYKWTSQSLLAGTNGPHCRGGAIVQRLNSTLCSGHRIGAPRINCGVFGFSFQQITGPDNPIPKFVLSKEEDAKDSAFTGLYARDKNISGPCDSYRGLWHCLCYPTNVNGATPTIFVDAVLMAYGSLGTPLCSAFQMYDPKSFPVGADHEGCHAGDVGVEGGCWGKKTERGPGGVGGQVTPGADPTCGICHSCDLKPPGCP